MSDDREDDNSVDDEADNDEEDDQLFINGMANLNKRKRTAGNTKSTGPKRKKPTVAKPPPKKPRAVTVNPGIGRGKHLTFLNYQWFAKKADEFLAKKRVGAAADTDDQLALKVQAAWRSAHKTDGRADLATLDVVKEQIALAKAGQLKKPATKKAMGRPPKANGGKAKKASGKGKGRPEGDKTLKKKAKKMSKEEAATAIAAHIRTLGRRGQRRRRARRHRQLPRGLQESHWR